MQYYDTTFERAYHPDSSYNIKIIVYDPEGNVLFPLSEESGDLFDYFGSRDGASRKTLENTASGRKEDAHYSDMELSGFTTAVAVEESQAFAPILQKPDPYPAHSGANDCPLLFHCLQTVPAAWTPFDTYV